MTEQMLIAASALLGLAILAAAVLHGWLCYLALKQHELEVRHAPAQIEGRATESGARIELADLKERIRKLEAIANGVDL